MALCERCRTERDRMVKPPLRFEGSVSDTCRTGPNAQLPTGEIPSQKLFESAKTFAFLDIQPLSRGHAVRHIFNRGTCSGPLYPARLRDVCYC